MKSLIRGTLHIYLKGSKDLYKDFKGLYKDFQRFEEVPGS